MDGALILEERAFPLRPVPDPSARFKGTYREAGWRRCHDVSAGDAVFTPWPHDLALFESFFTQSRNIAEPHVVTEIVEASGADMARFRADYAAGAGREAVLKDYRSAVEDDRRAVSG